MAIIRASLCSLGDSLAYTDCLMTNILGFCQILVALVCVVLMAILFVF